MGAQPPPQQVPTPTTSSNRKSYGPQSNAHKPWNVAVSSQVNGEPAYSILKPVFTPTPAQASGAVAVPGIYVDRTRTSCNHCRHSKKKCDSTRPICGPCSRAGKLDCAFPGDYGYSSAPPPRQQPPPGFTYPPPPPTGQAGYSQYAPPQQQYQQSPVGAQYSQQPPSQQQYVQQEQPSMQQYSQQTPTQGGATRDESPDPWFPKR